MIYKMKKVASPVGELTLLSDGEYLVSLVWSGDTLPRAFAKSKIVEGKCEILETTAKQLREYFAGKRQTFDLPVKFHGTDFQKSVWNVLKKIPYGKTFSYQEVAKKINSPNACRAVGLANGKNPIAIVVPCHRVIGKNGTLTGFGGGLPAKKLLLEIEGLNIAH